jgi:hypothetical protein
MSRITTPFNAQSTAAEVIAGVDLTGQRAAADIRATTGRDDVRVARVDLADRSTIDPNDADRLWDETAQLLQHADHASGHDRGGGGGGGGGSGGGGGYGSGCLRSVASGVVPAANVNELPA